LRCRYELNAVVYSKRLAKELEEDFERDLTHCTEFDLAAYQLHHTAVRFRESVARLLSPLL
jgi:cardiolipin synthase